MNIQTPQENMKEENIESNPKAKSNNSFVYTIIAIVLLMAAFFALNNIKHNNPSNNAVNQQVVNQQANKFEEELNKLPTDATKEQKYSYYLRLARAEYQQANYEDALKWLNQFPEQDKVYQGVWYTYALINDKMGQKDQALESIKKSVQLQSSNPQPWIEYFELIKDKSKQEQEAVYKEALQKTENDQEIVDAYNKFKSQ